MDNLYEPLTSSHLTRPYWRWGQRNSHAAYIQTVHSMGRRTDV